jgi:hypothetical protein
MGIKREDGPLCVAVDLIHEPMQMSRNRASGLRQELFIKLISRDLFVEWCGWLKTGKLHSSLQKMNE